MYEENVTTDVNRKFFFTALVGAGLSLLLLRSVLLAFFFLVPLGFLAYRHEYRIAWTAALFAALGNLVMALWARTSRGVPLADTLLDIVYFGLMAVIFTAIVAPPPVLSEKFKGPARFFGGSCLGALLLAYVFLQTSSSAGFLEYIRYLLNAAIQTSNPDAFQGAMLGVLSAEVVLEAIRTVMFRGGSLVSCILLFAVSRQIGLFLARFALRRRGVTPPVTSSVALFRVAPVVIWVFSASLLLVVLSSVTRLQLPEILLWNILILCVILYFTQGLGVLQTFLARFAASPSSKFFLLVFFLIVLFSPFLNVLFLGGLFLLGVVENWVPLRAPKINGPPSTPGAGDSEN